MNQWWNTVNWILGETSVKFQSKMHLKCRLQNGGYFGSVLTHWGRVTHICVGKPTTIGSDNGLSPGWRQAIIWTIAGILLIGPLGTNFSEILIGIQTFSFKKMHLKMSSAKRRPFVSASMCLCVNVYLPPKKHDKTQKVSFIEHVITDKKSTLSFSLVVMTWHRHNSTKKIIPLTVTG